MSFQGIPFDISYDQFCKELTQKDFKIDFDAQTECFFEGKKIWNDLPAVKCDLRMYTRTKMVKYLKLNFEGDVNIPLTGILKRLIDFNENTIYTASIPDNHFMKELHVVHTDDGIISIERYRGTNKVNITYDNMFNEVNYTGQRVLESILGANFEMMADEFLSTMESNGATYRFGRSPRLYDKENYLSYTMTCNFGIVKSEYVSVNVDKQGNVKSVDFVLVDSVEVIESLLRFFSEKYGKPQQIYDTGYRPELISRRGMIRYEFKTKNGILSINKLKDDEPGHFILQIHYLNTSLQKKMKDQLKYLL